MAGLAAAYDAGSRFYEGVRTYGIPIAKAAIQAGVRKWNQIYDHEHDVTYGMLALETSEPHYSSV